MHNVIKSILIIVLITLVQLSLYALWLKPIMTTWGASTLVVRMPMAGDDQAHTITSTRAIVINAPQTTVWKWLMQLGADRGGFYSYDFIERAMGYKMRHQERIMPDFKNFKVGDMVRSSIDPKSALIPFNFRVQAIKPDKTFVLNNWGTFLLQKVGDKQTRLIIRTQVANTSNVWSNLANEIIFPFHYIMERRTLIGIKARAEAGDNLPFSQSKEFAWFSGIILSGLLICFLAFIGRGILKSFIIPAILSVCWLLTLLLLNPILLYSIGLLLMILCIVIQYVWMILIKKTKQIKR
jgi:hypothetical protein